MLQVVQPPALPTQHTPTPGAPAGALTLSAGDIVFREGDPRLHVYRVETGALCLFRQRPDGSQDVIEFAFPGDLVGLGYLDSHVTCAQATLDSSLTCLPRSTGNQGIDLPPSAQARMTAAIEREVAFLNEAPSPAMAQDSGPVPLERVAALFVTLARCNAYEGRDPLIVTDSMNCGVVAGYLDISLGDLARCLKEMEGRGLIMADPAGLRLTDMDALERLAETAD